MCYDNGAMNGREFLRRARRHARRTGQDFAFYPDWGKGSHGRVFVGENFTTVPQHEIGTGLLATMLKDLNINRRDF